MSKQKTSSSSPLVVEPRLLYKCPNCHKLNNTTAKDDTTYIQCYSCRQELACSQIEPKPVFGQSSSDDKPKARGEPIIVGSDQINAQIPPWFVKTACALALFLFVVFVGLVAYRVADPAGFGVMWGAVEEVRSKITTLDGDPKYGQQVTFFVPAENVTSFPDVRWESFYGELKKKGINGFTRWDVKGQIRDSVYDGFFVFIALEQGAEIAGDDLREIYERHYPDVPFFVINEYLSKSRSSVH